MQATKEKAVSERVSMADAKRDLEDIVKRVAANEDGILIELDGKPQAAVVPVEVYEEWQQKQNKRALIDLMQQDAARANMTEEEAEELINEAVIAVRARKDQ